MDDWSNNIDSAPVFRPFTRDELEIIENRIFEKRLAQKKREEKRARNIAVSINIFRQTIHMDQFVFSSGKNKLFNAFCIGLLCSFQFFTLLNYVLK